MKTTPLLALALAAALTPAATADVRVQVRGLTHTLPFVEFTYRDAGGDAVRRTVSQPDADGFLNLIIPTDPPTPGTMCYFDEDGILVCLIIGGFAPNHSATLPVMPAYIWVDGVDGSAQLPPFQPGQHMTIVSGASPALGPDITAYAPTLPYSTMTPEQLLRPQALPLFTGVATVSGLIEVRTRAVCPADWNDDGTPNSADISAFLTAWLASLTAGGLDADFNQDQAVNSTDISTFLAAWLTAATNGC